MFRSGAKSWIFRYDFDGRRREMGLGSCNTVNLGRTDITVHGFRSTFRNWAVLKYEDGVIDNGNPRSHIRLKTPGTC